MAWGSTLFVALWIAVAGSTNWFPLPQLPPPPPLLWDYFTSPMLQRKPYDSESSPMEFMVDVTNALGVAILQDHANSRGNFAFSPYGVASVLVVLYEGTRGESSKQIENAICFPRDKDIIRIGFRDIHKNLKSYFSHEGFLSGITLNKETSRFKREFKKILKFYGYDVNLDENGADKDKENFSTINPLNSTSSSETPNITTTHSSIPNTTFHGETTTESIIMSNLNEDIVSDHNTTIPSTDQSGTEEVTKTSLPTTDMTISSPELIGSTINTEGLSNETTTKPSLELNEITSPESDIFDKINTEGITTNFDKETAKPITTIIEPTVVIEQLQGNTPSDINMTSKITSTMNSEQDAATKTMNPVHEVTTEKTESTTSVLPKETTMATETSQQISETTTETNEGTSEKISDKTTVVPITSIETGTTQLHSDKITTNKTTEVGMTNEATTPTVEQASTTGLAVPTTTQLTHTSTTIVDTNTFETTTVNKPSEESTSTEFSVITTTITEVSPLEEKTETSETENKLTTLSTIGFETAPTSSKPSDATTESLQENTTTESIGSILDNGMLIPQPEDVISTIKPATDLPVEHFESNKPLSSTTPSEINPTVKATTETNEKETPDGPSTLEPSGNSSTLPFSTMMEEYSTTLTSNAKLTESTTEIHKETESTTAQLTSTAASSNSIITQSSPGDTTTEKAVEVLTSLTAVTTKITEMLSTTIPSGSITPEQVITNTYDFGSTKSPQTTSNEELFDSSTASLTTNTENYSSVTPFTNFSPENNVTISPQETVSMPLHETTEASVTSSTINSFTSDFTTTLSGISSESNIISTVSPFATTIDNKVGSTTPYIETQTSSAILLLSENSTKPDEYETTHSVSTSSSIMTTTTLSPSSSAITADLATTTEFAKVTDENTSMLTSSSDPESTTLTPTTTQTTETIASENPLSVSDSTTSSPSDIATSTLPNEATSINITENLIENTERETTTMKNVSTIPTDKIITITPSTTEEATTYTMATIIITSPATVSLPQENYDSTEPEAEVLNEETSTLTTLTTEKYAEETTTNDNTFESEPGDYATTEVSNKVEETTGVSTLKDETTEFETTSLSEITRTTTTVTSIDINLALADDSTKETIVLDELSLDGRSKSKRAILNSIQTKHKVNKTGEISEDKLLRRFKDLESSISRNKRTIPDFFILPFLSQLQNGRYSNPMLRSGYTNRHQQNIPFLVDGIVDTYVPMMVYTSFFPYGYIPQLHSKALEFPLDDVRYKLLILLPIDRFGLKRLLYDLNDYPIREIMNTIRPARVSIVIPTFKVEGFVVLTPSLQKLGIRDVFIPRRANLSEMSDDSELFVRNIEQSITVVIKNYVENLNIQSRTNARRQVVKEFYATHPFLYFVIDSATNVALMAGKMVNPLSSRTY